MLSSIRAARAACSSSQTDRQRVLRRTCGRARLGGARGGAARAAAAVGRRRRRGSRNSCSSIKLRKNNYVSKASASRGTDSRQSQRAAHSHRCAQSSCLKVRSRTTLRGCAMACALDRAARAATLGRRVGSRRCLLSLPRRPTAVARAIVVSARPRRRRGELERRVHDVPP